MPEVSSEATKSQRKKGMAKYLLYIVIVLGATGISLASSLWGQVEDVGKALAGADWRWVLIFAGVVFLTFFIEALIIKIFVRLYTRKYMLYRGFAVALIGDFYNNVTPSASGGQIMQVYTMKKQGIQVSNAASIMVMWFILYQSTLIVIGIVTLIIKWNYVMGMEPITVLGISIPMLPIVLVGFALNMITIVLLLTMSYSHHLHNFILHYVINFLAKLKLVRNPDKTRENLRVQVENFKIELRRLQANIPVTVLIVLLFAIYIFIKDAMPYFSFMAIGSNLGWNVYEFNFVDMLNCGLLGSLHQMCAGIIPLPGLAGVSEYFFTQIYYDYLNEVILWPGFRSRLTKTMIEVTNTCLNASQILWRTMTYHAVTLVTGIVSALYRPRPRSEMLTAPNRQTFVDLQLATFDERKKSSDTMFETRQMSRKKIQSKLEKTEEAQDTSSRRRDYQNSVGNSDELKRLLDEAPPIVPSPSSKPVKISDRDATPMASKTNVKEKKAKQKPAKEKASKKASKTSNNDWDWDEFEI